MEQPYGPYERPRTEPRQLPYEPHQPYLPYLPYLPWSAGLVARNVPRDDHPLNLVGAFDDL